MRVDCREVEFAGDQGDHGPDGGQAREAARAAFGGLDTAMESTDPTQPQPRIAADDEILYMDGDETGGMGSLWESGPGPLDFPEPTAPAFSPKASPTSSSEPGSQP
jgi:hypothetical protein